MTDSPAPPRILPYGSWPSPLGADRAAAKSDSLGQVAADGEAVFWLERRPAEGGRQVVAGWDLERGIRDVTPDGVNARARVLEYGGGDFTVSGGLLFYVDDAEREAVRLLPLPGNAAYPHLAGALFTSKADGRCADFAVDAARGLVYCVRERGAVHDLIALDFGAVLEGQGSNDPPPAPRILAEGRDFYSNPTLAPDGRTLVFLAWDLPHMPWDESGLFLVDLSAFDLAIPGAAPPPPLKLKGSAEESLFLPRFSPDGRLFVVSDEGGFWNLRRLEGSVSALLPARPSSGGNSEGNSDSNSNVSPVWASLLPLPAECGAAQWIFGLSTYDFLDAERLLIAHNEKGAWSLGLLHPVTAEFTPLDLPFTEISQVRGSGQGRGYFLGGSPRQGKALYTLTADDPLPRPVKPLPAPAAGLFRGVEISVPRPLSFATADGLTAHAFYYPPSGSGFAAPPDERPPLLVKSHGGPTWACSTALNAEIQFFTSRGFAFLDVNYRGSTGYGRAYLRSLDGLWGIADVEDCARGALHCVEAGLADRNRLAIRGGSAGGYTALCALAGIAPGGQVFQAGASFYGVSDAAALARDTHKFESRYLDRLIGRYPEEEERYRARSPLFHLEGFSAPVIFFQGDEDKVVLPDQAENMVEALRKKGIPVEYHLFRGEGHGFRRAENVQKALLAELDFYRRAFSIVQPA